MKVNLTIETNNTGVMPFAGAVESLADLRKFLRKIDGKIGGLIKLLPAAKEAKITGLKFGKE